MPLVAEDRFHPGYLAKVLIDPEEVASVRLLGYGDLPDFGESPVVQLIYVNGQSEQVFDAYHVWTK